MTEYVIDTQDSYEELQAMLDNGEAFILSSTDNIALIKTDAESFKVTLANDYKITDIKPVIYGKNTTTNIVNISVKGEDVYIFTEKQGIIKYTQQRYKHWVLSPKLYNGFKKLKGNEFYKYYNEYSALDFDAEITQKVYPRKLYTVWNKPENYMTRHGYTYFKGMRVNDISLLSFDIETSGLDGTASNAMVFLITNCYRKNGVLTNKTFNVADYKSQHDMIRAWTQWVREMDPSIILGHNIVIFDLPYLQNIMSAVNEKLMLGRLDNEMVIDERPRELRKDGSQSYTYHKIDIFGREIVDTFFVAIKHDIARKYESYGLKAIIKHEGLDKQDRVYYDASQIKKDWYDLEKRKQIIAYAEADAEDPIKLFDLMIPSFFYLSNYIPKTFQAMTETATGGQINALMVRSYLQFDYCIPEATEVDEFEGGISIGVPGIYKNCLKWDLSSAYPHTIIQYGLYDKKKDPYAFFLKMVKYFTKERLKNKALAKTTGERFYKDLEQALKVLINSFFGFCAAKGLKFNSPAIAAEITRRCRGYIKDSLIWSTGRDLEHWKNKLKDDKK